MSPIIVTKWDTLGRRKLIQFNCICFQSLLFRFCSEAALELSLVVFKQSLKLYTPLYVTQLILSRKYDRKSFEETFRSILRSSAFLAFNAFLVILCFCMSRHLFGRFYFTLCAHLPSFIGSLMALMYEKPSRRKALAFYVANIASETVFNNLADRGFRVKHKNGEVYLFAVAVSLLTYFYENHLLRDPLLITVFKLLIGNRVNKGQNQKTSPMSDVEQVQLLINSKVPFWKVSHAECPHVHTSCLGNALYSGLLKPFLYGWTGQMALTALPKLLSFKSNFVRDYLANPEFIFDPGHLKFGLFLATFSSSYNLLRCLMRHRSGGNHSYHTLIACLLSSPSALISPSSSVSTYLLWKSIEVSRLSKIEIELTSRSMFNH